MMPARHPQTLPTLTLAFLVVAALSACGARSPDPSWPWRASAVPNVLVKDLSVVEDAAIGSPDVILDGELFRMVYAQGGTDKRGRIGLASSPDGIAWTKHGTTLEPATEGWDSWFLDTPAIIKVGATYYLYYFGATSNDSVGGAIGLAMSSDGQSWVRASANPVLTAGASGEWDELWVESPSVVHDGTRFIMFYTGIDAAWRPRVGMASSADGLKWEKSSANPILGPGRAGEWDDFAAAVPGAVLKDGELQLFYCSQSTFETQIGARSPKIGVAFSRDGTTWTRFKNNPVIDSSLTYSQPTGPYNPTVHYSADEHLYRLWYETGIGFGLVTGPELAGH